ncbi:hypothetical protein B5X24_HaOG207270 [Helicoverpa armigera]|uniref:Uncharacterized protein n=1 Tax=Helicoverpa armigera TaxID=29058 RepID=A0A2W1BIV6_HELAM|nr:hypothetical protein B5X24_HaOG207270 [Helicoverpa armigera]
MSQWKYNSVAITLKFCFLCRDAETYELHFLSTYLHCADFKVIRHFIGCFQWKIFPTFHCLCSQVERSVIGSRKFLMGVLTLVDAGKWLIVFICIR